MLGKLLNTKQAPSSSASVPYEGSELQRRVHESHARAEQSKEKFERKKAIDQATKYVPDTVKNAFAPPEPERRPLVAEGKSNAVSKFLKNLFNR